MAVPQTSLFGLQYMNQGKLVNPSIQECLNAVSEHQKLRALMKGDWRKGLVPLSSVTADYTVQRIRGQDSNNRERVYFFPKYLVHLAVTQIYS